VLRPYQEERPGLAGGDAQAGPGRAAGRRHGPGQDGAADRLPAGALRPGRFAGADRVPGIRARQLAPRAGAVRPRPVGAPAPRARPHASHRRPDRPRRRADLLLAAAARPAPAGRGGVAGAGAGRGAAGQEPAHARRAGGPRAARTPPDRAHGHADREPAGRAVVDPALPQPRPAGHPQRLPPPLRDADRAAP
jgi:hypothetical protein